MPVELTLVLSKPRAFSNMNTREYSLKIKKRVNAEERAIRKEFDSKKKKFLGTKKILLQSPKIIPKTSEPHFKMNPRVACCKKWLRIKILKQLKSFFDNYKDAIESFCAGDRKVIFPYGTYWMRVHHGALCEAPL